MKLARHTLWGTMLGTGLMWMSVFGVSQTQVLSGHSSLKTLTFFEQVQRYLSLRTVEEAKKACLLMMITMASLIIMVSIFKKSILI